MYIHICIYIYMYIHICIYVYVYICVCAYMCVYIYMYVYTYMCIHISAIPSYTKRTCKILWTQLKRMQLSWRIQDNSHASTEYTMDTPRSSMKMKTAVGSKMRKERKLDTHATCGVNSCQGKVVHMEPAGLMAVRERLYT